MNLLGSKCVKCFWRFQSCSYDERDDCDDQFAICSGFPAHPVSEFSIWEGPISQPNLLFTESTDTGLTSIRSLRQLANGSVVVEGSTTRIVTIHQGKAITTGDARFRLDLGALPTDDIQLSSISCRFHSNGTKLIAYLDYDGRVHLASLPARNQSWDVWPLTIAGAAPAIELFGDDVHVVYPRRDLKLVHWSTAGGFIPISFLSRAQVALHRVESQIVMLVQNVVTTRLDVSVFEPKMCRWLPLQPTSQNADVGVTPVFVANDDNPNCPYVLLACYDRLLVMNLRSLDVWPSRWMSDLVDKIGGVPLTKLLIPGSHDSGSYGVTPHSALGPSAPQRHDLADLFSNPLFSPIARHVATSWSRAQGMTIRDQLRSGIRYLDLRLTSGSLAVPPITFKGDLIHDVFIEHMLISIPITDALDQIKHFLDENPNEFLILDFQQMTGLNTEWRDAVFDGIERLFPAQKAVRYPTPSSLTLNQMWANRYQILVIVCCEDDSRPWLWHRKRSLISPWPNVPDPAQLKQALVNGFAARQPDLLFVLQGICTEDVPMITNGFLGHEPRSLKELALRTSPLVLQWLDNWPSMNIVIVDWIADSSLVAFCIAANTGQNRTSHSLTM